MEFQGEISPMRPGDSQSRCRAKWATTIASVRPRLREEDREVLEEDNISIRITDISKEHVASKLYNDEDSVRQAIAARVPESTRARIISIHSERTIEPLQINAELLVDVCSQYAVHLDFLPVVLSFGDEPHVAEASSTNFSLQSVNSNELCISYEIRYVEENMRGRKQNIWSLRHTGIYHSHTPTFDLFIVLHPMKESAFEKRILQLGKTKEGCAEFCRDPFRLHTMLFDSYFDRWRWYFRYLGDPFTETNNAAMIVNPEKTDASSSFRRVQELRNTIDVVLFARACCSGDLSVIKKLKNSRAATGILNELEAQDINLTSYIDSADGLQSRVQNAIDLVGYALTLHNQLETARVDKELRDMTKKLGDVTEEMKNLTQDMKSLTEHTVDDSATVKIITILSAIYLPGSFVGTMFGTNFFDFNMRSRQIMITSDFWIFIAVWIPLTLITIAAYVLVVFFDRRSKGKRIDWPWARTGKKALPPASRSNTEDELLAIGEAKRLGVS